LSVYGAFLWQQQTETEKLSDVQQKALGTSLGLFAVRNWYFPGVRMSIEKVWAGFVYYPVLGYILILIDRKYKV